MAPVPKILGVPRLPPGGSILHIILGDNDNHDNDVHNNGSQLSPPFEEQGVY